VVNLSHSIRISLAVLKKARETVYGECGPFLFLDCFYYFMLLLCFGEFFVLIRDKSGSSGNQLASGEDRLHKSDRAYAEKKIGQSY
jgi:hypothetical protein